MEPVLYSLQSVLRGALILGLSLSVFAQIPAAPDASGVRSGRKAPTPPLTVLPPAVNPRPPFEFRGIRIGDEIKEAQRKFLALKVPSLSSETRLVRLRWHYQSWLAAGFLLLFVAPALYPQTAAPSGDGRITGTAVNDDGEPVANASICTTIHSPHSSSTSCGSAQTFQVTGPWILKGFAEVYRPPGRRSPSCASALLFFKGFRQDHQISSQAGCIPCRCRLRVLLYRDQPAPERSRGTITTTHRAKKQQRQDVPFSKASGMRGVAIKAAAFSALKQSGKHGYTCGRGTSFAEMIPELASPESPNHARQRLPRIAARVCHFAIIRCAGAHLTMGVVT